jgi:CO dehydrogenase nickel-insertion accessory protein CooC1
MLGAGKYDDVARAVIEMAMAKFTAVLVIDGDKGSGFSVAVRVQDMELIARVPSMLREMANEIEKDLKHRRKPHGQRN